MLVPASQHHCVSFCPPCQPSRLFLARPLLILKFIFVAYFHRLVDCCISHLFFFFLFYLLKMVVKWKNSEAKKILIKDLLSGDVYDGMGPAEVYMTQPEYAHYEYKNFVTNLRNLRAAIRKEKNNAVRNERAYQHDHNLLPSVFDRTVLQWKDSDCYHILKEDIKNGVLNELSKRELWNSREEYQMYNFTYFYNHVLQEIRSQKERAYWSFVKSKSK